MDLLQRNSQTVTISNNSWNTGDIPDLRNKDESFSAVVFFQLISPEMIDAVACKNVIFVPMYDSVAGNPVSFWKSLWERNVRILNFSSTINNACKKLEIACKEVKYYPEPATSFEATNEKRIFFWQRGDSVSLEAVLALTGRDVQSLHHHKALDPLQRNSRFSRDTPRGINYSSSSWFENRGDYLSRVKECSIFVAPRLAEGIGMSFLEAMAMGKAVLAANFPTMCEYIKDKGNGYLFDPSQLKRVDFSDLENVMKRAYESVQSGFEKWKESRSSIMDWILTPQDRQPSSFFEVCRDFPQLESARILSDGTETQLFGPPIGTLSAQLRWFAGYLLRSRGFRGVDLLRFSFWGRLLTWPFRHLAWRRTVGRKNIL
ncbi:MAG: glycosyltransferase [Spirochaetia bacterium]